MNPGEPALPATLSGRSLLAVFAHPDDESLACGGLLAWCAARGARVSLICATRGEHGAGPVSRRADTRTAELEAAARTLGVSDLIILDHPDGMLPWVDAEGLEAELRDAIRRLRPDVVITFDEDGLYWHPDHIAIHQRTTAAVAALGGGAPALYYVTMPPRQMRAVVEAVASQGRAGESSSSILGIDADAFGASAPLPTFVFEAGTFAARKLAAIRCHDTQLVNDPLAMLSDDDAVRLLGTEHFRRASVGSTGDAFVEFVRGVRL